MSLIRPIHKNSLIKNPGLSFLVNPVERDLTYEYLTVLTKLQRKILSLLEDGFVKYTSTYGKYIPRQKEIARLCKCSRRTVIRAIKVLKDLGFIDVIERGTGLEHQIVVHDRSYVSDSQEIKRKCSKWRSEGITVLSFNMQYEHSNDPPPEVEIQTCDSSISPMGFEENVTPLVTPYSPNKESISSNQWADSINQFLKEKVDKPPPLKPLRSSQNDFKVEHWIAGKGFEEKHEVLLSCIPEYFYRESLSYAEDKYKKGWNPTGKELRSYVKERAVRRAQEKGLVDWRKNYKWRKIITGSLM